MRYLQTIASWPIRKKLLLLVIIAFLPGAGIITANGFNERERQLEVAKREALVLVESLAAQQEQIAVGTKQMLSALAQLPEVQNLDVEACNELFRKIAASQPCYANIALTTPDGNMVAGSHPFEPGSINLSDRKVIRDTIQTLDFSAGEYVLGKTSNLRSIHYGYPVLDPNNDGLVAVVTAGFNLDGYAGFIRKANLPEGSVVVIADHKGIRLYRLPEDDTTPVGKPVSPKALACLGGNFDQNTYGNIGRDDINRIVAFKQLYLGEESSPYLSIFVGIPKDPILHKANLATFRNLSLLGLAAALAMSLACFFGRIALMNPINRLVAATRRFGTGDMGARTGLPHTPDELGRLADSFDEMAALLETRNIERRNAEETLRESEERYRHIFSSMSDFAFSCIRPAGGDYAIDWMVGAVETITGYSLREIMDNRCWRFLVHPEDLPIFDRNVIGLEPGASGECELRIVRKDGSIGWIEAASKVAESSGALGPHRLFGGCKDITERKRAEMELKQKQADLLEIQHIGKIASLNWNLDNDAIEWTPEFFNIVERNPGSFPHTGTGYLSLVHPEDRKLIDKTLKDSILGETAPYMEYRFVMPDCRDKHVASQGKFVRNAQERPVCLMGYIQDISGRKEAEEEKRKLEEQLLQAVKLESVGRLAGGVAHDFNNMLMVILGYVEMVMDQIDPEAPLHADLKEIQQAARRSADLTRQLLAFARKQTVAPKVLDLNDTVSGMLKMLRRLIGEDVDLAWAPGANLWPVKIDPSQIDQILANLCANSRDALLDIGKVTIETSNAVFDKAHCARNAGFIPGDYVCLTVSDDGAGMEKETIEKIFEPFFTTKEVGKGTGLGLAVIYGIVKQNSGFIDIRSEPGKGATVRIYLPRFKGETVETREKEAAGGPRGAGETVLLVEDEPAILNMGKRMLETLGYRVLAAETPGKALRLVGEHAGKIDLLMSDVVMPEMNGRDLADQVSAIAPDLKCLFMSGYTADAIAHHGVLDAGVEFIQKPFALEDLAVKVGKIIKRK